MATRTLPYPLACYSRAMIKFVLAAVLMLVTVDCAVDRGAYTRSALHAIQRGVHSVAHMGDGSLFSG